MSEETARTVLLVASAYAAAGLAFATAFVARGAGRIDPAARGTSLGFRLLLVPGSAALWPVLLRRWLRGTPDASDRPLSAHDRATRGRARGGAR